MLLAPRSKTLTVTQVNVFGPEDLMTIQTWNESTLHTQFVNKLYYSHQRIHSEYDRLIKVIVISRYN